MHDEKEFTALYAGLSEEKRSMLADVLEAMNQDKKMDDLREFLKKTIQGFKPMVFDLQKVTTSDRSPKLAYLEGIVVGLLTVQDFLEGKKA